MNESISPSIIVKGLTKRFGNFTAVNGIDFEVQQGEIFGFLGPNGSGKTTTIRIMLGLLPPTDGEIHVLGYDVNRNPAAIRPFVGYMSQRFSLYNDLTVIQNLRFYGKAYGLDNTSLQTQIAHALDMAGLIGREDERTKDLAGGFRQRLALGAAILHQPKVLFLDEPTAGVDPLSRRAFWELLYNLTAEGITIFVTTHYMDEAEHCHRLALLQRGSIIASGSPKNIIEEVIAGEVIEIAPKDPIETIKFLRKLKENREVDIREIELYGSLIHILSPNADKLEKKLSRHLKKAGLQIIQMGRVAASLEDAFISRMHIPESIKNEI